MVVRGIDGYLTMKKRYRVKKSKNRRGKKRGRGIADYITPKNVTNALQVGSLLYGLKKMWKKKPNEAAVPAGNSISANPYITPTRSFAVY